jgi:colicin import membrane protein
MPVCEVHVIQGPGGIVLKVTVGACPGSTVTYRNSIENAVLKADPLPAPRDPALFDRELKFLFNPPE